MCYGRQTEQNWKNFQEGNTLIFAAKKYLFMTLYRSNNRLLANRMLRVRKLIQYVAEKLHIEDESSLELLCGDTPLTFNMTLAAIRQHILKTGGDIPISYRLKGEVNA